MAQVYSHETTDASIRPIVLTGVGLAIVAAIVLTISVSLFHYFVSRPAETPANPMASSLSQVPPTPRITDHPSTELQELHQEEDHILTTYGWIDRQAGKVRIPIDRAIDLELQRGFPVRQPAGKEVAQK
jgi:hypothetical protein